MSFGKIWTSFFRKTNKTNANLCMLANKNLVSRIIITEYWKCLHSRAECDLPVCPTYVNTEWQTNLHVTVGPFRTTTPPPPPKWNKTSFWSDNLPGSRNFNLQQTNVKSQTETDRKSEYIWEFFCDVTYLCLLTQCVIRMCGTLCTTKGDLQLLAEVRWPLYVTCEKHHFRLKIHLSELA